MRVREQYKRIAAKNRSVQRSISEVIHNLESVAKDISDLLENFEALTVPIDAAERWLCFVQNSIDVLSNAVEPLPLEESVNYATEKRLLEEGHQSKHSD
jgi:hypothetical protein